MRDAMELVLDANILFSALIRSGATRELMLINGIHLYAPEFIVSEFLKYLELIASKTGLECTELVSLMREILNRADVKIVPASELKEIRY